MRLNLGCGHVPLPGYVNIDQYAGEADVRGDVRELTFEGVEEIVMHHLLEHLPWQDVFAVLTRIRSWMQPGAPITIEVPDMGRISTELRPLSWLTDIYGSQEHEGEYHRSGYTAQSLEGVLTAVGFRDVGVRAFTSDHPMRQGMPCLEARAVA